MGKFLHRLRERRRDRRLARDLEVRFREQVDARTAAAARMTDDLRQA